MKVYDPEGKKRVEESEYHPASERNEVFLSDLASDQWIIFNKRVHPLLYDAIFERARVYGIMPKEIHHIITAEEAICAIRSSSW